MRVLVYLSPLLPIAVAAAVIAIARARAVLDHLTPLDAHRVDTNHIHKENR